MKCCYGRTDRCLLKERSKMPIENIQFADTPAEALGSMCKYLLQNGYKFNGQELIKQEEVK